MNVQELFSHCDLSKIPFPEWSDQDVNLEKWEAPVNKDTKKGQPKEATPTKILYVDDQDVQLPSSIPVADWKRPSEIYPNADFVITSNQIFYTDLKNGSEHLFESDFMRQFVSAMGILDYIGNSCPWKFESVGAHYTPNTDKTTWKPWHHIYSMSKISKGQDHSPKFNPMGKYVVRLYWLGRWRKIYIDDRLPVNEENVVLLPNYVYKQVEYDVIAEVPDKEPEKSPKPVKKEKNKKKAKDVKQETKMEVELWPFILCKALLKIACLSWNKNSELVDFNPINCLTGWVFQTLATSDMAPEEMWKICVQYTPKYTWPQDEAATKPHKGDSKKESKGKKDKSSSKGSKKSQTKEKIKEDRGFRYHLVACCSDITMMTKTENIPSLPADILIEQSRDIPLDKPPPRPEYARWKRFRWIMWALRKGLIPPLEDSCVKYLKLFSNLTKNVNEELKGDAKPAIAGSKGKNKKSSSKKESKSSKSSKKVDAGQVKIFPLMERSAWIDFNEIAEFIDCIYIFFKPAEFETVFKISDINSFNAQSAKKESSDVEMLWPSKIYESRNEPLYMFMDSLTRKYLVVNLAQMGNVKQLRMDDPGSCTGSENTEIDAPFAYVILETYNWQTNTIGYVNMFLNTCATKTFVISLKSGRCICRVWIKSDNFYVLTLLTDIPAIVGNIEAVLAGMTNEATSLINLCHEVSTNFGKLVQSFGTETFSDCLKSFHKTCKNNMTISKIKSQAIYDIFIQELLNLLNEIGQESDIFALKVLFLDPNITLHHGDSIDDSCFDSSSLTSEEYLESKREEMAAIKIQSIFKLVFVKKLLAYHNQAHAKYPEMYETLKRIYANVFGVPKRGTLCVKLLRIFLQRCVSTLDIGVPPIHADLSSVVNILSFNGVKSLGSDSFAIICRYSFECNSVRPAIIKICLFVNLTRFMVRVFDNETTKEIFRFTNNTFVWDYQKNEKGYTVLCYGWARQPTKLSWKLCFVYAREDDVVVSVPDQEITEDTIIDYYKPNVNNTICKCNLNVKQNTYVTLRLTTSSSNARLEIRCLNHRGEILASATGVANVILPICYLTCSYSYRSLANVDVIKKKDSISRRKSSIKKGSFMKANKQSIIHVNEPMTNDGENYIIEAVLLDQSWPLSINEWLVVNCEKTRSLLHPHALIYKSGSLISRESKVSKLDEPPSNGIQSPYWSLNIAYNVGDNVKFSKDTKRMAEINEIKRSWYEDDENRPAKSRRMRFEYLKSHSTKENLSEKSKNSSLSLEQSPLPSLVSSLSKDDSVSKQLFNKWNIESQILPPYDLSQYLDADSTGTRKYVKKDEWEQSLRDAYVEKSTSFAKLLEHYTEDLEKIRDNQLENFVIVNNWYNKCREDSSERMERSYKLRENFIDGLIQDSKANAPDVKDEKKNKGKTKEGKGGKKKK